MATSTKVEEILALTDGLTASPIDELVSNSNWGSINFEAARSDLKLLFEICAHLKVLPLEILPSTVADSFVVSLTQAGTVVTKLKSFSIESANPTAMKDEIVSQIKSFSEHLLVTTQSWIPFLAYQKGDIQKNIEALSQTVKEAKGILDKSKTEVTEKSGEITSIITAAREASATAGVGVFTSDFNSQAGTLETTASRWLWITALMAFASVAVALASFLLPLAKDASNAQIVQYMTSKLVILVVFLTATVWCGRIYKAIKHQATVNKHRANSLKTFQAFVKAASDDTTRDAVLLETTRSIFATSPSGYLETTESPPNTGIKVMEIFKGGTSINDVN